MTWARQLLFFSAMLFIMLLFSGCAAGPAVREPVEQDLNQALSAIDQQDYQQAAKRFDKLLQQHDEIQDEYRYDYGLALSETDRPAEAIEQLDIYIENLDRSGTHFLAALELRNRQRDSLARQQEEAENAKQAAENLAPLTAEIETGWKQIERQLAALPDTFTEPLSGIEMLLIKGGCYQMGDLFGDGEANERPVHQVCVDDFYLGKYEVTQGQWRKVMGYNPSRFQKGDNYPVETISWHDAVAFTEALSGTKGNYRLPTEAEWEYAARSGGQKEKYSGGGDVNLVSWHEGNSERSTHPVGQKQPNSLGLYDMSGNVYEWCLDLYAADYYSASQLQNPIGPSEGELHSRRGGSWYSVPSYSRASFRIEADRPDYRFKDTGLRLALPVE